MNKKGESGNETVDLLVMISGLVVGALVITGLMSFILGGVQGTREEILAMDLGMNMMLLQSMPYPVSFNYAPNLDDLSVEIRNEEVIVSSAQSTESYRMKHIQSVNVDSGFYSSFMSLPMVFDVSSLTLEDIDFDDQISYCESLPTVLSFGSQESGRTPQVYFEYEINDGEVREIAEFLENSLEDRATRNNNYRIISHQPFADITVRFSLFEKEEKTSLDITTLDLESNPGYFKYNCFFTADIRSKQVFDEFRQSRDRNSEILRYEIGVSEDSAQVISDLVRSIDYGFEQLR